MRSYEILGSKMRKKNPRQNNRNKYKYKNNETDIRLSHTVESKNVNMMKKKNGKKNWASQEKQNKFGNIF